MDSRPKKYWVVSQLFYPNETSTGFVMTKIAEKILDIGDVNVICGPADYQSSALSNACGIDHRIQIHRIKAPSWDKNNLFLRVVNFIIITISISWKILFKVKKGDTLILVTNPPILVILVAMIKQLRKFQLFIILHDIFPENLAVTGLISKSSSFYKLLLRLFSASYNKADHLIACGADMKDVVTKKVRTSMPITVITNWADHEEIFPFYLDRNEYLKTDLKDKIVIEFAGNIGRVQGLDKFLGLFIKANNPDLVLLIIGDGAYKSKLLQMKQMAPTTQVMFVDSKPRLEQRYFLNACDIGLVTLSEGMYGLGVPSKVYNILAAGKPVLYIGDDYSEVSRYIREHHIGWAFSWDQVVEIESFLKDFNIAEILKIKHKGIIARSLVESQFTKEYILNQYNAVLKGK